jgi:hypothetical protein
MTRRGALLVLCAAVIACQTAAPAARSLDPNADVVVPYAVSGGGEVRFTVHPRYAPGEPVTLAIDIRAGSQLIRGPLAGRVLASEVATGEQLVRNLAPDDLGGTDVAPGKRAHVDVTWDGRDDKGVLVPAQTYTLSLYFVVGEQPQRLGTIIEIRPR